MEYRRLGKSGLKLSEFSLGSWVTFANQLDVAGSREMMALAYDRGVNFFDNAEAYAQGRSEEIMGDALRELDWPRDSYCVSSKVFWGGELPTQRGLSRKHVTEACHAALRRLKVDYLDLYFCHRPDVETPIEETVRAMHDLISQGKILYWGTSEWDSRQLTEAYGVAALHHLTPPTMEQPQYNLFERTRLERDYLPLFENHGLGTTIWSPLASGLLTGKYRDGIPKGSRLDLPHLGWLKERFAGNRGRTMIDTANNLESLAGEAGLTLVQLALLWCLQNPRVSSVILGASRISQLQENLDALEQRSKLTAGVMEQIENIVDNKPELPSLF